MNRNRCKMTGLIWHLAGQEGYKTLRSKGKIKNLGARISHKSKNKIKMMNASSIKDATKPIARKNTQPWTQNLQLTFLTCSIKFSSIQLHKTTFNLNIVLKNTVTRNMHKILFTFRNKICLKLTYQSKTKIISNRISVFNSSHQLKNMFSKYNSNEI